jgi:hypothetical protein
MAFVPIQLPAGLDRNGSPYDSPGKFWDCNLFRWVSGSARPIGGWVRKTVAPLDSAIRRFHAWRNNDNTLGTLVGTEAKLYADFADGWLDITPAGIVPPINTTLGGYGSGPYGRYTYGTPRPAGISTAFAPIYALWSFANWGEDVLLLSSKDNRLFHYVSATPDVAPIVQTGTPAVPLANAVEVTEERHVMLAGVTMGGVYYPHRIAWASSESLTDWDFASLTNTAGFLDLACTSPLNFLVKVREGLLAFTSTEVFLIQYVGLPYIYGATKLADMQMFHPYTIAKFASGSAAWLSTRSFQVYSAGAVQPLPCPIFNDIKLDVNRDWVMTRSHASSNGPFPEVWFFWPSASSINGECDRFALFSYLDNWWGWSHLSRSAMFPSGALKYPLAGSADGNIYEHENGWTDAGLPLLGQRWLETGALGIGTGDAVMDIKQALLATDSRPQSVKLQFFGRYTPDGAERVFGPYTPRLDGYTDTRVNAREARIRYIGNVDNIFEVGQLRLDVSPAGGR